MNKFSAIFLPKPAFVHTVTSMMHNVFVYGTLKRTEPNHYWLTDEQNGYSKYISDGTTKIKYPLIIATKYNIPFLLHCPGKGHYVRGEVYEVDEKMLSKLDILEDHPNYYFREIEDIKTVQVTENADEYVTIKCWVYFLKNYKPELLKRPMWYTYSSKGPHGLPYMDRSKRDPLYNHKVELKDDNDNDVH